MKIRVLKFLLVVLLVHFALILLGGPGYRMEIWGFRTGLGFVLWAVYVAPVVLVLSTLLFKGQTRLALTNIVLALVLLAIPLSFKSKVGSVPRIHDITTDLEDPPQFKWAGGVRKEGDHPVAYDSKENGDAQRGAYSDLRTLEVMTPPSDAFQKALNTVRKLGWEIINQSESEGQIEATHTSFLYGFKDDVAIRIRAIEGKTELDLRSQSRVGISDLGANAARIRSFLRAFTESR